MILVILLCYLLLSLLTYIVVKFKIRAQHEWSDIIITFIWAVLWPVTWCVFIIFLIVWYIEQKTKNRKPPKWL